MKKNNKGFTLAELLIVVAIIAVLVAIAIPIFTAQLEKSRDATDQANIRAAYAELSAALITNTKLSNAAATGGDLTKGSFTWSNVTDTSAECAIAGKGTNAAWDNLNPGDTFALGKLSVTPVGNFTKATFTVNGDNQITDITLG